MEDLGQNTKSTLSCIKTKKGGLEKITFHDFKLVSSIVVLIRMIRIEKYNTDKHLDEDVFQFS